MDNQQVVTEIAWQIRRKRKEMGLTQTELGQKAGCGIAFVHLLENGKETVRFDKLLDVTRALGLQFQLITANPAPARIETESARVQTRKKFDFLD